MGKQRLRRIESLVLLGLLGLLGGCKSAMDLSGGEQAAQIIPAPSPSPLLQGGLSEVQNFGPTADLITSNVLLTDGFIVKKATYANFAQESVRLWLEGSGVLKLDSKLKTPIFEKFRLYVTGSVPVVLDETAIFVDGSLAKKIAGGSPDFVDLKPGEQAEIHWLLHSAPSTQLCVTYQNPVDKLVPFSAFLSGSIHISVKLSRPSDSDESSVLEENTQIAVGTPNWQVMSLEWRMQCQGLMRQEFSQTPDWCKAGGYC
jgi:hypothetical protein